jgi:uncharacterized protein (TIGR00251 family)
LLTVPALVSPRSDGTVGLAVRVKPRAATSRVLGVRDDCLEVAVAAPPVDGAANAELLVTLAKWLHLPRARLALIGGATGRQKVVAVAGVDADELRARCAE